MKIAYLLVGTVLLSACGGPVYRMHWTNSGASIVSPNPALVDCELKAAKQKVKWTEGNPIPAHPGRTDTIQKLAQQQAHYKATAAADDFYQRALKSCMSSAGFNQKRVCVKRCN